MDIEVARAALVTELALARRLGERKGTIPIYGYAKFDADFGEVGIAATDGDSSLETGCAAQVHKAGTALVPVRLLHEMVRAATAETVRLTYASDKLTVTIGLFKSKLGVLPVDQFPVLPSAPEAFIDLRAGWFGRALEKTRFIVEAATETGTAQYMQCGLLAVANGTARLVSADGRRLAIVESDAVATDATGEVAIPRKSLDDLSALLAADEQEYVGFAQSESQAFFKLGQRVYATRVLAAKFPPYERVIPKACTFKATVSRDLWLGALKRVMVVRAEESTRMALAMADGAIRLAMDTRLGSADESVTADLTGAWETAFDVDYLKDFLSVADVQVVLEHSGGKTGAKFSTSGPGVSYTYVLMPMSDAVPAPQPKTAETVGA